MSEKTPSSFPTPEIAPLVTGVERITIVVHDLAAAEAIYTRMLGRDPSWRRVDRSGGTASVQYDLDNMGIELAAVTGPGVWGRQLQTFLDARGEGIVALILTTDDITKTANGLTERGLPTIVMPANEATGSEGGTRSWRHSLMPRENTRNMSIIACERLDDGSGRKSAPLRQGVAPEAAISKLDHVVVMTSDADACKKIFGDQFGIRLALDHSKPEWGVRQLFFRLGGVTIEVVQPLDESKAPKVDHLWGVAWKVDDIRATHARLVAEGADMSDVTRGRKKGTEVTTVRKPTGGVPTILIGQLETKE